VKSTVTIRSFPAGTPTASLQVFFKTLANPGTTIASPFTDANGQVTFQPNLSPGPFTWEAPDLAPEPDVKRMGNSRTCGSGGAYSEYELPYVLRALGPGVVRNYGSSLAVSYATGGLNLDLGTGAALSGQGIPAVVYSAMVHAVDPTLRNASNPRACYLVLEWTGLGQPEEGKVITNVVCGTPAASPVLPAGLNQQESIWQEALASFQLPISSSTVLSNIVGRQRYIGGYPQLSTIAKRLSATAVPVTNTTGIDATFDSGAPNLALANGIVYDVVAQAAMQLKAPSGGTISLAVLLDNTLSVYTDSNISTDFVTVSSVTTKQVLGAGVAITNSIRLKVSAPTGQHGTGYLLVTATPRR
jgi:hypothetical protein